MAKRTVRRNGITVTTNFSQELLDFNLFKRVDASGLGDAVIEEIKGSIARGSSPVKGEGRFAGYAAQRIDQSRYPMDRRTRRRHPGKKKRPVNLSLNGEYLKHYTWWLQKFKFFIGFSASKKRYSQPPGWVIDFFETHNDGSQVPDVPQRKHLPNKSGDDLKENIKQVLRKELEKAVNKFLNIENKKR